MADTTKPFSTEEMLPLLHHLLADLQSQKAHAEGQVADWGFIPRKDPGHISDFYREQTAKWMALAEWGEKHISVVEQVIAILAVLSHPSFAGIGHHWEACKPTLLPFSVALADAEGDHRSHVGETVLEAILKAHEAIKAAPVPPRED